MTTQSTGNQVPQKKASFYLPELDVLRFFAFLTVFIHHSLPITEDAYQGKLAPYAGWIASTVKAGGLGVDLFFALSSFLICELLIREYNSTGAVDAVAFYKRRMLRIFPLFFAFLLLTIFVLPQVLEKESFGTVYIVGYLLFAGNWAVALYGFPMSVAAPLWSVSIEEQFYLAFPFLVKRFKVRNLKNIALTTLAVACVARLVLVYLDAPDYVFWVNTFGRLDPIALGILLAVALRFRWLPVIEKASVRAAIVVVAVTTSILAVKFLGFAGRGALLFYPLIAVLATAVIWAFISPEKRLVGEKSFLIKLGRISYGLYVFHVLGLTLAQGAGESLGISGNAATVWRMVVGFLLTVAAALLSFKYLESPFLRLKHRRNKLRNLF